MKMSTMDAHKQLSLSEKSEDGSVFTCQQPEDGVPSVLHGNPTAGEKEKDSKGVEHSSQKVPGTFLHVDQELSIQEKGNTDIMITDDIKTLEYWAKTYKKGTSIGGVILKEYTENGHLNIENKQYKENLHYEIITTLGSGAEGTCYLAKDMKSGFQFVIKTPKSDIRRNEIICMARLAGTRGIVQIYGVLLKSVVLPRISIILEYVKGCTLAQWISLDNDDISKKKKLALALCEGFTKIHNKDIVHDDMNMKNVMVKDKDNNLSVTIIDFGRSKLGPFLPAINYFKLDTKEAIKIVKYMLGNEKSIKHEVLQGITNAEDLLEYIRGRVGKDDHVNEEDDEDDVQPSAQDFGVSERMN